MISKHLVEQMGGEIGYDSEPNVRTAFWVEFNLLDRDELTEPSLQQVG
jgi:signal transduction histidine kinase